MTDTNKIFREWVAGLDIDAPHKDPPGYLRDSVLRWSNDRWKVYSATKSANHGCLAALHGDLGLQRGAAWHTDRLKRLEHETDIVMGRLREATQGVPVTPKLSERSPLPEC